MSFQHSLQKDRPTAMSLRANINHLAAASGIKATIVTSTLPTEYRGEPHWRPLLDASVDLLLKTGEPTIRLHVGDQSIVVQAEGTETAAVVFPTGHPIAKSLRRMVRRMARKARPARPANPRLDEASVRHNDTTVTETAESAAQI